MSPLVRRGFSIFVPVPREAACAAAGVAAAGVAAAGVAGGRAFVARQFTKATAAASSR